nr:MAG TPA_asm: hypothetical protein [Caudoviricetes sp.]
MLPKEVKNRHIAKSQKPVEPKERDCKALCDFNKFFHRSRLLGKHEIPAEKYIIFAHKGICKVHGEDEVAGVGDCVLVAYIIIRAAGKNSAVHGAVQDNAEGKVSVKCEDYDECSGKGYDGDFDDGFHSFVLSRAD